MGEWFADGGSEAAPDHWRREVDDRWTLSVWPRFGTGEWVWEVWDFERDTDEPITAGKAPSFEEAKKRAEDAQEKGEP